MNIDFRKIMKTKTRAIVLMLSMLVFAACSSIQVCIPNKNNLRYAQKHENIKCMSVNQIKQLLEGDTIDYKVIIIYSPCCGPSLQHFKKTYSTAYRERPKEVKFYFFMDNTGGIRYAQEMMDNYGFGQEPIYCIVDDSAEFSIENENRMNNITNYLFPSNKPVTENYGVPCNFIVSKDNKLLKQKMIHPNGVGIYSKGLYEIDIKKIDSVDFDVITEIQVDWDW